MHVEYLCSEICVEKYARTQVNIRPVDYKIGMSYATGQMSVERSLLLLLINLIGDNAK